MLERDPELGARRSRGVPRAVATTSCTSAASGSIHATVTFEGARRTARGPWEGENAITKAAPLPRRARRAARRARASSTGSPTARVTTVTQAQDGGRGRNVVPDRFVAQPEPPLRARPRRSSEAQRGRRCALVGGRAQRRVHRPRRRRRCPARATRSCARSSRRACAASSRSRRGPTSRASRALGVAGGQLRARRERAGAPEERVDVARARARGRPPRGSVDHAPFAVV